MGRIVFVIICLMAAVVPPAVVWLIETDQLELPTSLTASGSEEPPRGKIYYFTADWCRYCDEMKPKVKNLRREGVRFRTIDVDLYPEMAGKYNVNGVPTFIYIEDGEEVARIAGSCAEWQLRRLWNAKEAFIPYF